MATNPMHQFEVYRIGPEINLGTVNLSFTNASFFIMGVVAGILNVIKSAKKMHKNFKK